MWKNVKNNGKEYSTRMLCELFSNFSISLKLFQNRKLKTWPSVLNPSLGAEPQREGIASLVSVLPELPESVNNFLVVLVLLNPSQA